MTKTTRAKRTRDQLDANELKKEVNQARAAGVAKTWTDGGGLYLTLAKSGSATFIHKFQFQKKAKERWFPGDFPKTISLSEARAMRDADRRLLRDGKNPITENRTALTNAKGIPTLAEYAKTWAHRLAPKNANGHASWLRHMTGEGTKGVTVGKLASMPMDQITREDVKAIIEPIWDKQRPTAEELLGRIYRTWDHWQANLPDGDLRQEQRNPADPERIEKAIGSNVEHKERNRAALAWKDVPAFLAELRKRPQVSARALEMIIATGCRCSEIAKAQWKWVELKGGAGWLVIPESETKTGQMHMVPLTREMVRILRIMAELPHKPDDLIFPNGKGNRYSTREMLEHVKVIVGSREAGSPTTHGFRTAVSGWGLDAPHRGGRKFDAGLLDMVLAHKVPGVRGVYQRVTRLPERKEVMREWSRFCNPPSAVVVPFIRRAA